MKLFLHSRDRVVIGIAATSQVAAGVVLASLLPPAWAIALGSGLAVALVLATLLYTYRKREAEEHLVHSRAHNYQQTEALFSLYSLLDWDRPIPFMRNYAISPDTATLLLAEVHRSGARKIVECGSGVSTLFLAKWLQKHGGGHVWALDHDEGYAARTRELLADHGLSEFATVITAPLRPVDVEGRRHHWYDPESLGELPSPIELLFVDGPPVRNDDLARFPTVPLLRDRFAPGIVVLVDDYARPGEKECVRRWLEALPSHECTEVDVESGLAILRPR